MLTITSSQGSAFWGSPQYLTICRGKTVEDIVRAIENSDFQAQNDDSKNRCMSKIAQPIDTEFS